MVLMILDAEKVKYFAHIVSIIKKFTNNRIRKGRFKIE